MASVLECILNLGTHSALIMKKALNSHLFRITRVPHLHVTALSISSLLVIFQALFHFFFPRVGHLPFEVSPRVGHVLSKKNAVFWILKVVLFYPTCANICTVVSKCEREMLAEERDETVCEGDAVLDRFRC